jgi:YegS/Rv2252/BmrU family lipid kinase
MIAIIINPISGGARRGQAQQRAELALSVLASCREDGEVFVSERKGHVRELAAGAVARGVRLVIAWGGDGTMNEAASALMHGPTPLSLVPSGSGNGLARELRVDFRPDRAIRDALGAAPRTIDAGEFGGRPFFSVAGVGFDAHVAACLDVRADGRRGFSAYARITARELWAYRCGRFRIDEAPPERRAVILALANSPQFGSGARIAPGAKLDDGLLDLVIVEETSRLATIRAIPRLFVGGLARLHGVSTRQVERTVVTSDTPMTFHVDGEPFAGGTRLEGRVLPGALRICVR